MVWYIDMDGTIAKWQDVPVERTHDRGFFLSRSPEIELIRFVRLLMEKGAEVRILSCAYDSQAIDEKTVWLMCHGLGDVKPIFVPYGGKKELFLDTAPENACVVSDYSRELNELQRAGVKTVKFYNGFNGTHGTYRGASINFMQTASEMAAALGI